MNDQHVVYRLRDREGVLLYVGMTGDWAARRQAHRSTKAWWPEVDESRTEFEQHSSRMDAARAEIEAMAIERPWHMGLSGRPRAVLTAEQFDRTNYLRQVADSARDEYRDWVVDLLADGCSFSEVSKATGLSTNTLQRWKREAGR